MLSLEFQKKFKIVMTFRIKNANLVAHKFVQLSVQWEYSAIPSLHALQFKKANIICYIFSQRFMIMTMELIDILHRKSYNNSKVVKVSLSCWNELSSPTTISRSASCTKRASK